MKVIPYFSKQNFKEERDTGKILGAYHKPLARLVQSLGLQGEVERHLTTQLLIRRLDNGHLVMLSVDRSKINSQLSGGHLMLVHSYDPQSEIFVDHDSDSILADNGEDVEIQRKYLDKISNRKGISLKK